MYWDGKLGVWPFVKDFIAKRSSKNRFKCAVVKKIVALFTRAVYKKYVREKVISSIKKWSRRDKNKPIHIQHDKCRVHISVDPDVVAAGISEGTFVFVINQRTLRS